MKAYCQSESCKNLNSQTTLWKLICLKKCCRYRLRFLYTILEERWVDDTNTCGGNWRALTTDLKMNFASQMWGVDGRFNLCYLGWDTCVYAWWRMDDKMLRRRQAIYLTAVWIGSMLFKEENPSSTTSPTYCVSASLFVYCFVIGPFFGGSETLTPGGIE